MSEDTHLIWSNFDLDYTDWKADLEDNYPHLSEQERVELMYEINNDYLGDERINLNIQLSRPILVIADLGLWNGRHDGYKELQSGNISDCLYSDTDYSTWYVDKQGDLRCDAIHHDGPIIICTAHTKTVQRIHRLSVYRTKSTKGLQHGRT